MEVDLTPVPSMDPVNFTDDIGNITPIPEHFTWSIRNMSLEDGGDSSYNNQPVYLNVDLTKNKLYMKRINSLKNQTKTNEKTKPGNGGKKEDITILEIDDEKIIFKSKMNEVISLFK